MPSAALLAAALVVATFHNDTRRSGAYVMPGLDLRHAAALHSDAGFRGEVQGNVLAQPLFWRSAAHPAGLVIVATERNHVTALDPGTGMPAWDRVLGAPVAGRDLPCGNIDPLGVTGTPVLDPATGTLYLVAQTAGPAARVFALDADSGAPRPGWPLDLAGALGPRFDVAHQGQRGALTLAGERLIIPFGGRSGDCGPYHGWLVAVDTRTARIDAAYATPGEGGGIWSFAGAALADGALFAATGNTFDAAVWSGGEAVLRFDPAHLAAPADDFAPADWRALDATDTDLGGSNPEPLAIGGRRLVLALGKDGKAYVLDADHLGGIGGPLLVRKVSTDQIRTSPANWTEADGVAADIAVARRGADCPPGARGFTVLRLRAAPSLSLTTAWCAPLEGAGSPITTTTDGAAERIVWVIGADGDDRLHGFAADTGAPVFSGGGPAEHMHGLHYTTTILAAARHLYVGAEDRLYAFTY